MPDDTDFGLLVTEEDGAPETLALPRPPAAVMSAATASAASLRRSATATVQVPPPLLTPAERVAPAGTPVIVTSDNVSDPSTSASAAVTCPSADRSKVNGASTRCGETLSSKRVFGALCWSKCRTSSGTPASSISCTAR